MVVVNQPTKSVSRGLQVETEDLIQFSSTSSSATGDNNNVAKQLEANCGPECHTRIEGGGDQTSNKVQKKRRRRAEPFEDSFMEEEEEEDDDEEEEEERCSARTADEQIDYLESLEPCPCYAKCCIDSVITLFCVTLLG